MKDFSLHQARFHEIHGTIQKKIPLKWYYQEVYQAYLSCIERSPPKGKCIEIGSGCGFAKEIIPQIITTDLIPYPHVERVMDATTFDFDDESLSTICMFNVLHHIPNVSLFFKEAIRCLVPKGRIFMREPYAGLISTIIFKYFHHEPFNKKSPTWEFNSQDPLLDANNALPYIIFKRDLKRFKQEFPQLALIQFKPHTPLRYWLTGGLKSWSLLPKRCYQLSKWLDQSLLKISSQFGSFVDIELVRQE